mmetsp:Transcript_36092/g.75825  ORF Transcript_36092/g.75825 Transcript_36092/m.75825 type:complete len:83 (+) Transcript_36092:416-664(+)
MALNAATASNFAMNTNVVPKTEPIVKKTPGIAWYNGAATNCTGVGIIRRKPQDSSICIAVLGSDIGLPDRTAPFGLPEVPPV